MTAPARDPASVSVSMIFHNPGPFFDAAVQGVLHQTYTSWELLLVDDGSTDGSDALARRYAEAHPHRIRYLHHPGRVNRGTAPTRNLGIGQATGKYFTEVDADDVWLPDFLEQHVGMLEADPSLDMVFSPVQRWYSWSGDPEDEKRDWVARPWPPGDGLVEPPGLLPVMLENSPQGGVPKGLVIRREAVVAVGGYPSEFRDMYEDQALLAKLAIVGRARIGDAWLYRYRRHPQSMVTVMNTTRDRRLMRLFFLEWLAAYLRSEGVTDPAVTGCVERELWKVNHPRLDRARSAVKYWSGRVRRKLAKSLSGPVQD
ncbi:MAG: glycosyltransferase family 2 protein [Gemmatimonadales bacterium]|nr:MAG: glycosyltransferase family 2 protein [Gemmatimonadales bacterium]